MNIMIFTDNTYMYKEFKKIIESNNLNKKYNFHYSCSPNNKLFADNKNVEQIDIKAESSLLKKNFDLIFSCHSKQIFPPEIVNNIRCINIHPGLNPYNRGWYPQVFSIINKKPLGVTIHEMDEEIDHGDIIYQKKVDVFSWDTSFTIYNRILQTEVSLLKDNIVALIEGNYQKTPMVDIGNYNTKEDFQKLCKLNLEEIMSMHELIDRLRALSHNGYKNAYFIDEDGNKIYVSIKLTKENDE